MNAAKGFTVVELMVTLMVAAIVLTIAVPSFQQFIQQNRLVTTANTFVTALSLARSEAIHRGMRVTVCKSADGENCTENGNWDQGWIVFADPNNDAEVDGNDEIIRVHAALGNGQTLSGNGGSVDNYVSYTSRGHSQQTGGAFQAGTIELCDGIAGRKIILNAAGRVRVENGDDKCP